MNKHIAPVIAIAALALPLLGACSSESAAETPAEATPTVSATPAPESVTEAPVNSEPTTAPTPTADTETAPADDNVRGLVGYPMYGYLGCIEEGNPKDDCYSYWSAMQENGVSNASEELAYLERLADEAVATMEESFEEGLAEYEEQTYEEFLGDDLHPDYQDDAPAGEGMEVGDNNIDNEYDVEY